MQMEALECGAASSMETPAAFRPAPQRSAARRRLNFFMDSNSLRYLALGAVWSEKKGFPAGAFLGVMPPERAMNLMVTVLPAVTSIP